MTMTTKTTMIHHVTFAVAFFRSNDQTTTHTHLRNERKKRFCSRAQRHKENELKQEAKQDNRGSQAVSYNVPFYTFKCWNFAFLLHNSWKRAFNNKNKQLVFARLQTYRNDRQVEEGVVKGRWSMKEKKTRRRSMQVSISACEFIGKYQSGEWTVNTYRIDFRCVPNSQNPCDKDKFHSIFHGPFLFIFVKNRSPPNTRINFFSQSFSIEIDLSNRYCSYLMKPISIWVDLFFIHEMS